MKKETCDDPKMKMWRLATNEKLTRGYIGLN